MIYLYETTEQINMEEFRIASGHSRALINAFPVPLFQHSLHRGEIEKKAAVKMHNCLAIRLLE
jgi:hypothetical protein